MQMQQYENFLGWIGLLDLPIGTIAYQIAPDLLCPRNADLWRLLEPHWLNAICSC